MTPGAYDAIVVGAGHNGLVTATYLAKSGLRTLVLERSESTGGCAATEELWPGHHVDVGAHETNGLDRRVTADLGLERAGLRLIPMDPMVRALQPDGPDLELWRDPGLCAEAIRPFSVRDAERWGGFVEAMGRAGKTLAVLHEAAPPVIPGAGRAELIELARLGLRLGRIGRGDALELTRLLPMTIQELLEEWFEHDALLGSLAALGCRGVLQGPMAAGTAYVFLRSLVSDGGPRSASWVCGGMARLGVVLSDVARAAGVEVRTGARVGRILVEDGAVRGVELESGETVDAGVVASSADPVHTLLGLVDPAHLDPEFVRDVGNIRIQGACAKVHLALDGLPGSDTTPAASMCLAPSIRYLERAYDDAKYGRVSTDPHLEVLVPSVLDPSVAPDGRHVASVLFQYAPRELREGSWDDEARASLADAAIGALDRCVPGFAERVTDRHVSTPADLEARFGLTGGHMHHGEMTLDQSFLGRPVPGWTRYEMPVRGLYLCGAGAHPGGGLTGTPGANAARAITRRRR